MARTSDWFRAGVLGALAIALCSVTSFAQEKKEKKEEDRPRITAIAPLELLPGTTTTLRIRGAKLAEATEVRFSEAPSVEVRLKEKKNADVPNGLDAKNVGDSQVTAEVKLPADFAGEKLRFRVLTPAGETEWKEIRVIPAEAVVEEKEPDNGFREAQPISSGKLVRGTIKEDKDVDVLRIEGHRGKRLRIEVFAARGGSLLDPTLMLFNEQHQMIASGDDADESRDAWLETVLPADGVYFVSVADANDRGGTWHAYTLEAREVQP